MITLKAFIIGSITFVLPVGMALELLASTDMVPDSWAWPVGITLYIGWLFIIQSLL